MWTGGGGGGALEQPSCSLQFSKEHFGAVFDNKDEQPCTLHFPLCVYLAKTVPENEFLFNGKSQFVTSQHFQNVTGKSQLSQPFG